MGSLARAFAAVRPGYRAWRGAALGVIVVLGGLVVYSGAAKIAAPAPNWAGVLALLGLVAVAAVPMGVAALAGLGVIRFVRKLPAHPLGAALYVLSLGLPLSLAVLLERDGVPRRSAIGAVLFAVVAASLAGAGLSVVARRLRTSTVRRRIAVVGLVVGVAQLAVSAWWLGWNGTPVAWLSAVTDRELQARSYGGEGSAQTFFYFNDPRARGTLKVRTLTYGSGKDSRRPEFGEKADLRTEPVDGRPFVRRWSGPSGWARTRYWGFDASAMPLRGTLYLPDEKGPFPVVVAVHGNHPAEEPSDTGYAYLGELLASRGMAFVSVDESFLNESLADLMSGHMEALIGENAARAWLLLSHLAVFREWTATPGHPLEGKLDMGRVGLVGHSRGGEAALVAAMFNRLDTSPDDPSVRFNFGFGIGAVAAIAPVDGQYEPGGARAVLRGTSYLVLQGNLDSDVGSFQGAQAFQRVDVTGEGGTFKAGVLIDRANHGQFNTAWGRSDLGGLAARFLATTPILPSDEQERIAAVYLSAFFRATLLDVRAARALFREPAAGTAWLPDVPVWKQYQDASMRRVATFDEDTDLATTTLAGGSIVAEGLNDWHEGQVPMKAGPLGTRAAFLAWSGMSNPPPGSSLPVGSPLSLPPSFVLRLPESFSLPPGAALSMHFAVTREDSLAPLDLTIELTDRAGNRAHMPLSYFGELHGAPSRDVWKFPVRAENRAPDTVFQCFDMPLSTFARFNGGFDATRVASVALVFDRTSSGAMWLDDVAFRHDARE